MKISEVTPWIALASGYRRGIKQWQKFDEDWDYDIIYSYQIGMELSHPWFAKNAKAFAPYNRAKIIVFYPNPFAENTPHWGKHFIAYVRGATGVKNLDDLGYGY
jgi:hypothetical protein